jgi:hypothetical protein
MEVAEGALVPKRGHADGLRKRMNELNELSGAFFAVKTLSLSRVAIVYPVAIARVALIRSFSTLHKAARLRSRGRQWSVSQR